jgi:dihydrofolate reductase
MIKTFIIVAHTADGFIAPIDPAGKAMPSTVWTSGADKKKFIELTKKAGTIVMGLTTFNTIGKALTRRLNVVYAPKGTPAIEGVMMTDLSPKELLEDLEKKGHKEVAICGGSTIYTMFMQSGLVNKIYITVEPKLFGQGLTIFNKPISADLKLVSVEKLSDDVLFLEYDITN